MNNYNYYINFLRNKNERNFFDFIIRYAENTTYNHVEISCELKTCPEVNFFYGSVMPISRMATPEQISKTYTIIKRRKLDVVVTDVEAFAILYKYLGKEYSILENVVIYLKISIHCMKKYFTSVKLNLDKYLNCTEYASRFLEEACGKTFVSVETNTLLDLDNDEYGELVVDKI
jgi:hypothetical protein